MSCSYFIIHILFASIYKLLILNSRLNVTIICSMLPSSFINWVWMLLPQTTDLSEEPYIHRIKFPQNYLWNPESRIHKTKQNRLGYKVNDLSLSLLCYISKSLIYIIHCLVAQRCIVLDIEGTTTPITFVTDVLFPYARENVGKHLSLTYDTAETQEDIKLLRSQVMFLYKVDWLSYHLSSHEPTSDQRSSSLVFVAGWGRLETGCNRRFSNPSCWWRKRQGHCCYGL